MRGSLLLAAVLAVAPLAGCLDGGEDGEVEGPRAPPANSTAPPPNGTGALVAGAPELEVGTAFVFETDGIYTDTRRMTMVVAEADGSGYLLAGGEPMDLVYDAAWQWPFMGRLERSLNRAPDADGYQPTMYRFPLSEDASWTWGSTEVSVARAAVPVPGGEAPGFVMERRNDDYATTWTYAPVIGFTTSFSSGYDGARPYLSARLVAVEQSESWTWYETLERYDSTDTVDDVPLSAQTFQLPAATEAVLVSAGGTPGNPVLLTPPPGAGDPWSHESAEGEQWIVDVLDPADGPWTLETADPNDGYAFASVLAVDLIGPAG